MTVTVTNTDRRTVSSALTVTLARNPTAAPFAIGAKGDYLERAAELIDAQGLGCEVVDIRTRSGRPRG